MSRESEERGFEFLESVVTAIFLLGWAMVIVLGCMK